MVAPYYTGYHPERFPAAPTVPNPLSLFHTEPTTHHTHHRLHNRTSFTSGDAVTGWVETKVVF
jgi:hypothetical protein